MTDYIIEMSYEDTKECFDTLDEKANIDYGALLHARRFDSTYNKLDMGILQYKIRKYGSEIHFNNPRRLNQQYIEENMDTDSEALAQVLFEETQVETTAMFLSIKWGFKLHKGETVNEGLTLKDE